MIYLILTCFMFGVQRKSMNPNKANLIKNLVKLHIRRSLLPLEIGFQSIKKLRPYNT